MAVKGLIALQKFFMLKKVLNTERIAALGYRPGHISCLQIAAQQTPFPFTYGLQFIGNTMKNITALKWAVI